MNNNTPIEMFDVLWAPGQHSLCVQTNGQPFRTFGFYDDPAHMLTVAQTLPPETNVWWGVHAMRSVAKGRGGSDDVVAVTCLAADFDWADPEAHKGTTLPSEAEVRSAVAQIRATPTIIVNSGHGLQVYWGLVEVLNAHDGQVLSDGFFRYIEETYGLHNDRTDLASVLRLPGSFNNKAEPVEVVIESNTRLGFEAGFLLAQFWRPEPTPEVPSLATVPQAGTGLRVGDLGWDPANDGETPFDWLNRTFDSAAALQRLGWLEDRRHGSEVQYVRPGKDPRQGTSATLHTDTGAIAIFTTSVDTIYSQVGLAGRGCWILKPADLWMVENGVTDRSTASRMIRAMMPTREAGTLASVPAVTVQGDSTAAATPSSANLPDEFWTKRRWLSHIRDAAHNRQASADAILGAVIARYAAMVPPMYRIPPIVMTASTFDHISVLVAESAGGKSGAMAIARELLPGQQERKDLVWEWPVSSGEGLVSAFFEMVQEEDSSGKKVMKNKKTKTAVHFSVDEALGLVNQSQRQGTTIGSVLCTAWSGGDPGQGNASADRQRVGMVPGSYRMAGVAAIQLSLGHKLLEDTFVQQGLSGRLVFFAAEDVNLPHWTVRPDWPGPLNLPIHPTMPVTIEYERSIHDEILEQNHQKMSKKAVVAPIDGHLNLVKLKMAGIFALMDDRTAVTADDWDLAGLALSSHLNLRNKMLAMRSQQNYEKTVTAATAQATFEDVKEETKERKALARLRDSIIRHIPPEGVARGQLRKVTTSKDTRHRFDAAMTKALEDGAITIIDGRIHRV